MSDPLAVSILAKLTSWYSFDGDLTDAHGANPITVGLNVAGYQSGLKGQELKPGSRGAAALASPFPLTMSSFCCVGGWLDYTGAATQTTVMSLGFDFNPQNEALYANSDTTGDFIAGSWVQPGTEYNTSFKGQTFKKYPVTVQVSDALGAHANSPQVIAIDTGIVQSGRYFVVSQWVQGQIRLYVDGQLRNTVTASTPRSNNVSYFQVGNQYGGSNTPCGLDEVFFCQAAALTSDEIAWLYNAQAGRSYAELLAAAS